MDATLKRFTLGGSLTATLISAIYATADLAIQRQESMKLPPRVISSMPGQGFNIALSNHNGEIKISARPYENLSYFNRKKAFYCPDLEPARLEIYTIHNNQTNKVLERRLFPGADVTQAHQILSSQPHLFEALQVYDVTPEGNFIVNTNYVNGMNLLFHAYAGPYVRETTTNDNTTVRTFTGEQIETERKKREYSFKNPTPIKRPKPPTNLRIVPSITDPLPLMSKP